ncbi:transposase zinc-binding domain-containing protein (plasmid) [Arsenophonus nasoniae]|nr:transposase zinc-binding domain-containing protein [Arsenophonus nasoniae]WGM18191.1 transposase zinc-binding domain-containing protein [Arsenophonus nasoniae]
MFSQPFFCQSCKSKACSSCGFKATEQWLAQQVHILPDCDWQHYFHHATSPLAFFLTIAT